MPRAKFKKFNNQIVALEKEPRVIDIVAIDDNAAEGLIDKLKNLFSDTPVTYQTQFGERPIKGTRQKRRWLSDISEDK